MRFPLLLLTACQSTPVEMPPLAVSHRGHHHRQTAF